jgi:fatty acid synthase subunit beta
VKELLGNINSTLIQRLLERKYNGDKALIPTIDYLSPSPSRTPIDLSNAKQLDGKDEVTYEIGRTVPETTSWLETLAGDKLNWLRAFITFPTFVQGGSFVDNPIRRILAPRAGQRVIITSSGGIPSSLTVYGAARSYGTHDPSFKAVKIQYDSTSKLIDMTMYEDRQDASVPLSLQFEYKPSHSFAPIHEIATGRNTRIKQFYWKLWYGDDAVLPDIDIHETFVGPEVVIEATAVETFCAVVGNKGESFKTVRNDVVKAPMDFAIVTGWKVSYCYDGSISIGIDFAIFSPKGYHESNLPFGHRRRSVKAGSLVKRIPHDGGCHPPASRGCLSGRSSHRISDQRQRRQDRESQGLRSSW